MRKFLHDMTQQKNRMVLLTANDKMPGQWRGRLLAAAIHLGLSIAVASIAAILVFLIWYPYPYREISGGRELFTILISVDVVLGPIITLTIFNIAKPRKELIRDLCLVAAIQLGALGYGMWTVFVARPVHLVFEIDRLRVVHAVDIDDALLSKKASNIEVMPMFGPTLLAVRPFKDSNESFEATMAALQGAEIGARPDLWQPWDQAKPAVLLAAKPVSELKKRFPQRTAEIEAIVGRAKGVSGVEQVYLPVVGRKQFWTALLDPITAEVIGFINLDPF